MTDQSERAVNTMNTAKSDPSAVDIDAAESLLSSDNNEVRNTVLKALFRVADEEPDAVASISDAVVERLEDPYRVARSHATMTVMALADQRPDTVESAIPALVNELDNEVPLYRFRTAGALGKLLESHPEAFVDHADALFDVLVDGPRVELDVEDVYDPDDPQVMNRRQMERAEAVAKERNRDWKRSQASLEVAANALVEVARVDPAVCASRLPELEPVIAEEEPAVRGAAIEIVRHVAEGDPDAINPLVDVLLTRLNDDEAFVRGRAIRALGFAEVVDAIEPLRAVAEDDPDDTVAELANDTADWIAERS